MVSRAERKAQREAALVDPFEEALATPPAEEPPDPFAGVVDLAKSMPKARARELQLDAAAASVRSFIASYGCENFGADLTKVDVFEAAMKDARREWCVDGRIMNKNQIQVMLVHLVSEGEDLPSLCRVEGMPRLITVTGWLEENPEFQSWMARAERAAAMLFMAEAMQIADGATPKTSFVAKLRMDMRTKVAELYDAKKWSKKQLVEFSTSEQVDASMLQAQLVAMMLSNAKRYREDMGVLVLRQSDLPKLVLAMAKELAEAGVEVMKNANYVDTTFDLAELTRKED